MFNAILVVCTGNICRSPLAEMLLKQCFPTKKIISAGIKARDGNSADLQAIQVAKDHQLNLAGHVARVLTLALCREVDLILVMEKRQADYIHQHFPETRGKVMLLGQWLDQAEIPDPYRKSDEMFESVYQLIEKAVISWQDKL